MADKLFGDWTPAPDNVRYAPTRPEATRCKETIAVPVFDEINHRIETVDSILLPAFPYTAEHALAAARANAVTRAMNKSAKIVDDIHNAIHAAVDAGMDRVAVYVDKHKFKALKSIYEQILEDLKSAGYSWSYSKIPECGFVPTDRPCSGTEIIIMFQSEQPE